MLKKILFVLSNFKSLYFIYYILLTNFLSRKIHNQCIYIKKEFEKKILKKRFNYFWFLKNIPFIVFFIKDKNNVKKILEIGSYEGLSSNFFLSYYYRSFLYCVDPFIEPGKENYNQNFLTTEKNFDNNLKDLSSRFKKIKKRSNDFFRELSENEKFDIIFIDGAHNSESVYLDAKNSWKYLKKEGYLIFDDFFCNEFKKGNNPIDGIDKFLKDIKRNYKILGLYSQLIILKL